MTLPGYLFNLPNVTDFVTSTGVWSSAIFEEFQPLIYMIIGIGLVVLLIGMVIKFFR